MIISIHLFYAAVAIFTLFTNPVVLSAFSRLTSISTLDPPIFSSLVPLLSGYQLLLHSSNTRQFSSDPLAHTFFPSSHTAYAADVFVPLAFSPVLFAPHALQWCDAAAENLEYIGSMLINTNEEVICVVLSLIFFTLGLFFTVGTYLARSCTVSHPVFEEQLLVDTMPIGTCFLPSISHSSWLEESNEVVAYFAPSPSPSSFSLSASDLFHSIPSSPSVTILDSASETSIINYSESSVLKTTAIQDAAAVASTHPLASFATLQEPATSSASIVRPASPFPDSIPFHDDFATSMQAPKFGCPTTSAVITLPSASLCEQHDKLDSSPVPDLVHSTTSRSSRHSLVSAPSNSSTRSSGDNSSPWVEVRRSQPRRTGHPAPRPAQSRDAPNPTRQAQNARAGPSASATAATERPSGAPTSQRRQPQRATRVSSTPSSSRAAAGSRSSRTAQHPQNRRSPSAASPSPSPATAHSRGASAPRHRHGGQAGRTRSNSVPAPAHAASPRGSAPLPSSSTPVPSESSRRPLTRPQRVLVRPPSPPVPSPPASVVHSEARSESAPLVPTERKSVSDEASVSSLPPSESPSDLYAGPSSAAQLIQRPSFAAVVATPPVVVIPSRMHILSNVRSVPHPSPVSSVPPPINPPAKCTPLSFMLVCTEQRQERELVPDHKTKGQRGGGRKRKEIAYRSAIQAAGMVMTFQAAVPKSSPHGSITIGHSSVLDGKRPQQQPMDQTWTPHPKWGQTPTTDSNRLVKMRKRLGPHLIGVGYVAPEPENKSEHSNSAE